MNPKQKPGLEISTVGDEVLVHDVQREKVHVLNMSAGKILELCDGTRTMEAVAADVARLYSIGTDRVQADVDRAVGEFKGLGILELDS